MSAQKNKLRRSRRRAFRVRTNLRRVTLESGVPRVSVFRSLKHVYAQIIDDVQRRTLVSCSSLELAAMPKKGADQDKRAVAHAVGKELARKAIEGGVARVVFDRGQYLYHGRVRELAEGLRAGGVQV